MVLDACFTLLHKKPQLLVGVCYWNQLVLITYDAS